MGKFFENSEKSLFARFFSDFAKNPLLAQNVDPFLDPLFDNPFTIQATF